MIYILLALPALVWANSQPFTNSLKDKPIIECGSNHISLKVQTEKDAPAHIFAKGYFKKEGCTFSNAANASFDFSECGVRRKREIKPNGISFEMTVVVQLHPLFVTKVDRAFHVQCFFKEEEKAVGTGMNVSDLASVDIDGSAEPPKCEYRVTQDSPNGPLVHLTEVGRTIFHTWDCPSETHSTLVHSCEIVGGETTTMVIDENGCSLYDEIFPNLIYSNNLTKAVVAVSAFNFPDVTQIQYTCKLKSCVKGNQDCNQIMPPKCGLDRVAKMQSDDDPEGPLTNDIENDQLITTSTTAVPSTTTTQSTTVPPTTTTIPTTTTTLATTTVVTTTVTEVTSSTTGVPETTTTVLQTTTEVFPTPEDMSNYVDKKISKALDAVEGSGAEDIDRPTPVSLIVASDDPESAEIYVRPTENKKKTTTVKRRRDAIVESDISSQSMTVVEKDSEISLPDPAAQSAPRPVEAPSTPTVCIPMAVFYSFIGIFFLSGSLIVFALCYAQRQKNKFRMLP